MKSAVPSVEVNTQAEIKEKITLSVSSTPSIAVAQEAKSKPLLGGGAGIAKSQEGVRVLQQRLLLLNHASKCSYSGKKCPVSGHCYYMKKLWEHMLRCKEADCKISHCISSRYVLSHYGKCKDSDCAVCPPVRASVKRERGANSSGVISYEDRGASKRQRSSYYWWATETLVRCTQMIGFSYFTSPVDNLSSVLLNMSMAEELYGGPILAAEEFCAPCCDASNGATSSTAGGHTALSADPFAGILRHAAFAGTKSGTSSGTSTGTNTPNSTASFVAPTAAAHATTAAHAAAVVLPPPSVFLPTASATLPSTTSRSIDSGSMDGVSVAAAAVAEAPGSSSGATLADDSFPSSSSATTTTTTATTTTAWTAVSAAEVAAIPVTSSSASRHASAAAADTTTTTTTTSSGGKRLAEVFEGYNLTFGY